MKERRLAKNAKNGMVKSAYKMIGNNPKLSRFFFIKLKHTHVYLISWRKVMKKNPKSMYFSIFARKKAFFQYFYFYLFDKKLSKKILGLVHFHICYRLEYNLSENV